MNHYPYGAGEKLPQWQQWLLISGYVWFPLLVWLGIEWLSSL